MTTRDEVLAMARGAGISESQFMPGYIHATMADIERFHALAVANEREECAKVCESVKVPDDPYAPYLMTAARLIRARSAK